LSMLIYPPAYLLSKWQYRMYKKKVVLADKRVSLVQEAIQTISMIKMTASEGFWYNRLDGFRQQEYWLQLKARIVGAATGLL
jgi:ABC-type bacteriocin/lantibiotic exporter with double-glycine peptidase domain